MKPWRFAVLWLVLFVVAVSTGVELLSYLSYLVLFVFIAMSILARLTLEGLSVKRTLGQSYAHLGDTIELAYELTNDHSLGKLWLEVFEKSNWPPPVIGLAATSCTRGTEVPRTSSRSGSNATPMSTPCWT